MEDKKETAPVGEPAKTIVGEEINKEELQAPKQNPPDEEFDTEALDKDDDDKEQFTLAKQMDESDQHIILEHEAEKEDNEVETPPLVSPKVSPVASPKASPVTSPKASPVASPRSSPPSSPRSPTSNAFDKFSESIQLNIEGINEATKEIEKANSQFQSPSLSGQEASSLMNKVNKVVKYTNIKNRDTVRLVRSLRLEATKPVPKKQKEGVESRSVEERDSLCRAITRSFTDDLLLYQSAGQDFKNDLKERLTKQIQSIRPKANDDFVDLSLRSESNKAALFRDIMATDEKDMSEEKARAMKDDIAEKYIIISDLSKASSEMNKVFLNLRSTNAETDSDSNGSSSDEDDPLFGGKKKNATNDSGSPPPPFESRRSKRGSAPQSPRTSAHRARILSFLQRHSPEEETGNGIPHDPLQGGEQQPEPAEAPSAQQQARPGGRSSAAGPRKRRGKGRRWLTLFLLATVAIAALAGLLMMPH